MLSTVVQGGVMEESEDHLVDESMLYMHFSPSSFVGVSHCHNQPFSLIVSATGHSGQLLPPKVMGVALDFLVEISDLWSCDCKWVEPGKTGFLLHWVSESDEVDKMLVFSVRSPSFVGLVRIWGWGVGQGKQ